MADTVLKCSLCKRKYRASPYDSSQHYTCKVCGIGLDAADARQSNATTMQVDTPGDEEPPDPLIGAQIETYKIVEKLGEGGMGAVYKAEHVGLRQFRALKILDQDRAQRTPKAVQRFRSKR